jgi:hypothetical protein
MHPASTLHYSMEGPRSMAEDSWVGPESTPSAASYVALSDSCEYCSVHSIVQKTGQSWIGAILPPPEEHRLVIAVFWLQYSTNVLQLCGTDVQACALECIQEPARGCT